jgi:hypothetical protein
MSAHSFFGQSAEERESGMQAEERRRINAGFQCPECWGARIETRYSHFQQDDRFCCLECGCIWSRPIPIKRR